MGARAYKLSIPQVKVILDFLTINRYGKQTKDDLVDLLLDFLGEPKKPLLKGASPKKADKKKTKRVRKSKGGKDDEEEDEEDNEGENEEIDEEDGEDENNDADDDADYDDVGDETVEQDGKLPSDEVLRRWVRAYVRCHNMKTSTIKNALEIASDKFGVDMSEKKQRLKELLTDEM